MLGVILCGLEAIGLSPVAPIATLLGAGVPALNLVFSIVITYPLAVVYSTYIRDNDASTKNLFIFLAGLDLAFFNFGLSVWHSLLAVCVFIATTTVFGPGRAHTLITFVFNMLYLSAGYYFTESEEYDITWTMAHCVLVLKLIGCSFDIWDGLTPFEKLSEINKKTALADVPSPLEMLGFVYCPVAFLVGPQFSMKRYQNMVNEKYPLDTATPSYKSAAMKRFATGVFYLAMFQVGGSYFSQAKLTTELKDYSFVYKHVFIGFWGRFLLYKYLACWLLAEGSCIRLGLAFDGEENGVAKWTGAENVRLVRYEGATKFGNYIDSFNVNTNNWVGQYVFRRLRFLGNKYLSQFLSLLFLAVWHGLTSGYYMTFAMEYIIIFMEKELEPILEKLQMYKTMWGSPFARAILAVLLRLYTFVFMGYCMIPFDLKLLSKWWSVYSNLYFSGFVVFIPWAFVYKPLLLHLIKRGYLN